MAETTIPNAPAPTSVLTDGQLARMSPADRKKYLDRFRRRAAPGLMPSADTTGMQAASVLTGPGTAGSITDGGP